MTAGPFVYDELVEERQTDTTPVRVRTSSRSGRPTRPPLGQGRSMPTGGRDFITEGLSPERCNVCADKSTHVEKCQISLESVWSKVSRSR